MMTILGMVPYMIVGGILGSMGYGVMNMNWQLFAILGCMCISEFISMFKYSR